MNIDLSKIFGKRLKEIRKSKNLTQSQLAELINIEDLSLSRIETGQRFPQKNNIVKIAQVLDVEIKELFDFRYQKSEKELRKDIENKLDSANLKELQYINKIIDAYRESIN